MFKIDPAPTFECDVALTLPGKQQTATLPLTFRHKTKRELAAFLNPAKPRTDIELLSEIIVGWGVENAQEQPVKYSAEALEHLLDQYPSAALQIHEAYVRELSEARRKN